MCLFFDHLYTCTYIRTYVRGLTGANAMYVIEMYTCGYVCVMTVRACMRVCERERERERARARERARER